LGPVRHTAIATYLRCLWPPIHSWTQHLLSGTPPAMTSTHSLTQLRAFPLDTRPVPTTTSADFGFHFCYFAFLLNHFEKFYYFDFVSYHFEHLLLCLCFLSLWTLLLLWLCFLSLWLSFLSPRPTNARPERLVQGLLSIHADRCQCRLPLSTIVQPNWLVGSLPFTLTDAYQAFTVILLLLSFFCYPFAVILLRTLALTRKPQRENVWGQGPGLVTLRRNLTLEHLSIHPDHAPFYAPRSRTQITHISMHPYQFVEYVLPEPTAMSVEASHSINAIRCLFVLPSLSSPDLPQTYFKGASNYRVGFSYFYSILDNQAASILVY